AYAMYKNGFKYWFDKEENKLIEINNSNYILRTLEEEAIMNEFCPCSKEEEGINIFKWTASEVMLFLSNSGLITNNAASAQRVGKALIKLGYIRFKSNGRMFYKIKKK
ncbi:MAG: virulence-associated E family protein, partial [Flavobacteriales bacterium]|nr:virulence-associated E family protein [Flavobacteriales bacterium]